MRSVFEMIDRAFEENTYPGDQELTVDARETDETWKLLHGKDWRNMPVAEFMSGDTPFPNLTPRSFHFYLPALLKGSLKEDLAGDVLHSLAFYLNPTAMQCGDPNWDNPVRHKFERFRSLLTATQLETMQAVFEQWREGGWIDEVQYHQLKDAYAK